MMLPQTGRYRQPMLFELDNGTEIHGKVFQQSNGRWRAIIEGGWWSATGKTKKEAVRLVKKRYHDEIMRYKELGG